MNRNKAPAPEYYANGEAKPQEPLRFVMLPDKLPHPDRRVEERYEAARRRMYKAQLEAAEIAAEACWPEDYDKARREFQMKLLDLFSQTCERYGR